MSENLREILMGGQTFSWSEESDGLFSAVLNEKVYRIRSLDDAADEPYLRSYFDLDYDYEKAMREISAKDAILKEAVEKVGMLRLLKQDHFIATISFILSQNNNIKRIKGIGPKVASCILIFSYQKREGFPMDVWMKKVMSTYYPGKDKSYFSPYEALSQQYLFSWIRMIS